MDPTGRYAYFGGLSGTVVKVDLATFQSVGAVALKRPGGGNANYLRSAVIDPAGRYAYFTGLAGTAGAGVYKIDLATFEHVGTLVLEPNEIYPESAIIDPAGRFAYFATSKTDQQRIVKVDLTSPWPELRSSGGRHRAVLMAASAQFSCPPPRRFPWPLTPGLRQARGEIYAIVADVSTDTKTSR